jgi:uncharacterized protein (TIGR00369 family)
VSEFEPGERFYESRWVDDAGPQGPHLWRTLGYRRTVWEPGHQVIEWEASEDYGFPTNSGYIIHGGMVSTVLDTAMGGACWSLLNKDDAFLTADLRVEFLRTTRPGLLRAEGRVVRRARRVVFCGAELYDGKDSLLAAARCTQVLLPAEGSGGGR